MALTILGPFLILGAWAYFELTVRAKDDDAKALLNEPGGELAGIEERRAAIEAVGDEEGIPRRSDGYFDGRSTSGRELNRELESLDQQYVAAAQQIHNTIAPEAKLKGARAAAATWAAAVGLLYWRTPELELFNSTIASFIAIAVGYFTYRGGLSAAQRPPSITPAQTSTSPAVELGRPTYVDRYDENCTSPYGHHWVAETANGELIMPYRNICVNCDARAKPGPAKRYIEDKDEG